jgi:hypothetical protein
MLVDVLRRNKNWLPPIVYLSVNDHRQDGLDLDDTLNLVSLDSCICLLIRSACIFWEWCYEAVLTASKLGLYVRLFQF